MLRRWKLAIGMLAAALVATACNYAYAPFLIRVDGAVVLTGADLGIGNLNLEADRGLAYRWDDDSSSWVQIPLQVDERIVVDFGAKPSNNNAPASTGTIYGSTAIGHTVLTYADPDTWVGPDDDLTIDDNDEVVFLARDAGPRAPAATPHPAAAIGGLGKEIALVDPDGGTVGYVYLFYGGAGVDSSAGVDHVTYTFSLDAGTYKDDYLRADGPNPESSTVVTDNYTMTFGDRWITDGLSSNWGTGVDILDGHKSRFSFLTCGRSNATFADAEGAFIANIDGPIRAIRAYIGANSGPLTQRTEVFYEDRYEQITDLRVHAIPGVMSYWDWSAAASGMTYRNSEIAAPVTIDGSPDTVPVAVPAWEYIEGAQADITFAGTFSGSFVPTLEQVYVDETTPSFSECWGDGDFYGAAGQAITNAIPNTDPALGAFDTFQAYSVAAVWPTNLDMSVWAPAWAAEVLQSLDATVGIF
ncbi:MAG: hypothetical protein DHS20C19_02290 [Acidimicrobiales bacterium]|nr:MAG: hypothetical protein DHS20C19_02290 [Acidimicrobiales bacterium]